MLTRKILFNLVAAGVAPIILSFRWLPNVYDALIHQKYRYYYYQIETLGDFLYLVYGKNYVLNFVILLIFIFLPLQLIKDSYFKNGRYHMLTFFRKWIILTAIVLGWIVFFGTFSNIWWTPPDLYKNLIYIVFAGGFSIIFTTFFHFTLDRFQSPEVD